MRIRSTTTAGGTALLVLALWLAAPFAKAADVPPSDESIRQLLDLTEARKLLEGMRAQMDDFMKEGREQAQQGRTLTPEQQKVLDRMDARLKDLLNRQMQYAAFEPVYLQIYRQSFTQEEVDALVAFYRSPTGQMVIRKMPVVMSLTLTELQRQLAPVMLEAQQIEQEAMKDLQQLPAARP